MELMYASLLLHKLGHKVDEASVKKVIQAAGGSVDDNKVKALVAALKDVDIDQAIKEAAIPIAQPAQAGGQAAKSEEKKKEEEKKSADEASSGLSALFG
ncbi:MAG: 50S ribosomal protein L12 [Nanoarchaeota archaeon]